jgi:hypothetical protein
MLGEGVLEQPLEQAALSVSATYQPRTRRLKISMIT